MLLYAARRFYPRRWSVSTRAKTARNIVRAIALYTQYGRIAGENGTPRVHRDAYKCSWRWIIVAKGMHPAVTAHASNSTAYRALFTTRSERIARSFYVITIKPRRETLAFTQSLFFAVTNKMRSAVLIPPVKSHRIQGATRGNSDASS